MNAALLLPLPSDAYARALPLVPDEPHTVMPRAALLAHCGESMTDDPDHPTVIAVDGTTVEGRVLFLYGDPDSAALAAFVRALSGPLTLHTTAAIAARLPLWRSDVAERTFAMFTLPPSAGDAVFVALPPGGVRRLRPNDARHLANLPAWLWDVWQTPEALLRAAPVYARYLRGELVSIACVIAETERYAQIAAYTIERTRRNGFARECAQRLIGAVVGERGKQPVLTVSTENDAAIALAASLGMTARTDHTGYAIL